MKRIFTFFIFCLLLTHQAQATHIVGGEMNVKRVSATQYIFTLYFYFDEIKGDPASEDDFINVAIFEKSTNRFVTHLTLNKVQPSVILPFEQRSCIPNATVLKTKKITYQLTTNVNQNAFNNPAGYYISFERCCRNASISNILRPNGVGTVFYTEFPAFKFIASSTPIFKSPKSNYACINQPFTFDFSATDVDGDSLTYEFSEPLAGFSGPILKDTIGGIVVSNVSGPYPTIKWQTGYDVTKMIPSNPTMAIDNKGQITLTPTSLGLFLFSVTCREFRNGVQIGLVKRDYQLLVIFCPTNLEPVLNTDLTGLPDIKLTNTSVSSTQDTTYTIEASKDKEISFNVLANDPDSNNLMKISASGTGFDLPAQGMSFSSSQSNRKLTLPFSWTPTCANIRQEFYTLQFTMTYPQCGLTRKKQFNVIFHLKDDSTQKDFKHINIFTPNGDNHNDLFYLADLPRDICDDAFDHIEIFNRWGRRVFFSQDRHFTWDGNPLTDGIYFYVVAYTKRSFKGTVEILR